jgi:hypothetical protein
VAESATNLEAAFARLEGVVTTEIKHLSHDVKNLNQKLDAYATRRDLDALDGRVSNIEDDRRWMARQFWGIWISGFGVVIAGAAAYIKLAH